MLSSEHINMNSLVTVNQVDMSEENLVGVKLPYLKQMKSNRNLILYCLSRIGLICLSSCLKEMLELKVRLKIDKKRVEILQQAVKKVTQRVKFI